LGPLSENSSPLLLSQGGDGPAVDVLVMLSDNKFLPRFPGTVHLSLGRISVSNTERSSSINLNMHT